MTKIPHKYNGTGSFCLTCFKDRYNPIHSIANELPNELLDSKDFGPSVQEQKKIILTSEISRCKGHTCAKCKTPWNHDYNCDNHEFDSICKRCIEESTVLINREHDVTFQAQVKGMTPREIKEEELAHYNFVEHNIFRLPDGTDNPNWLEVWENHYKNLETLIEKFRVKQSAALRAKADKRSKDNEKLTPEERADFERAARSRKNAKDVVSSRQKEREDTAKKYNKDLAKLVATLKSAGLNEQVATEKATELLKGDK